MINIIDAKGLSCPEPVVLTKKSFDDMQIGDKLQILVDSEVAKENVVRFVRSNGGQVDITEQQSGEYIIDITK